MPIRGDGDVNRAARRRLRRVEHGADSLAEIEEATLALMREAGPWPWGIVSDWGSG